MFSSFNPLVGILIVQAQAQAFLAAYDATFQSPGRDSDRSGRLGDLQYVHVSQINKSKSYGSQPPILLSDYLGVNRTLD